MRRNRKRERRRQREGRKLSINQKAISVGVRLAAPRFLAGLIAFHYKFPPQPIRDRSVAVQPAGPPTHTLISSPVTDTHLMTRREPRGRPVFTHTVATHSWSSTAPQQAGGSGWSLSPYENMIILSSGCDFGQFLFINSPHPATLKEFLWSGYLRSLHFIL